MIGVRSVGRVREVKTIQEFKAFIMKGNVLDLAVGIIIGVAFGTVVNSMVNDVIMPPIGVALGGVDFKDSFMLVKAVAKMRAKEEAKKEAEPTEKECPHSLMQVPVKASKYGHCTSMP